MAGDSRARLAPGAWSRTEKAEKDGSMNGVIGGRHGVARAASTQARRLVSRIDITITESRTSLVQEKATPGIACGREKLSDSSGRPPGLDTCVDILRFMLFNSSQSSPSDARGGS